MAKPEITKRNLLVKEEDQNYGTILKKLGGGKFSVQLNLELKPRIGKLRGKLKHGSSKKLNFADIDSTVLVSLRDFEDGMVDIIHVYDSAEVRQLKKLGEIQDEEKYTDNSECNADCFDFNDI